MSDRRRLVARLCPFFIVVLFASSAAAQVKPRIVIAVDTSSSMLSDLNGTGVDTITDGDGVGRRPLAGDASQRILDGVYYGCGNGGSRPATGAGLDRNGDCFPNDSRIWIAKDAIRKMILAFGDVEWSLARFRQNQVLNAVPSTGFSVDIDNGSCSAGGEGQCLNSYGPINYAGPCCSSDCGAGRVAGQGEVLVGFPFIAGEAFANKDNRSAILRWMDFVETNFKPSSDASRAARDVCDHAAAPMAPALPYDCELRVPPISGTVTSYTPLGGLIHDAGEYAAGLRTAEVNAGLTCRNYAIILLTDGAETCGTNPNTEATTLRTTHGIKTYVVGVSVTAGDQTSLTAIAQAGGTTAYFANSPAALSAALSQVVADSMKFEVCDGLDNDCDGDTDEDLPAAQPGTAPQPEALFCDGEANRTAAQNMQVQRRDEPEYDNIALATEIPPPNKVVCGRVADTCENPGQDDDCDGAMDEDGALTTCGTCPGAPEACNGIDDDCDGVLDESPSGSGMAFAVCPTTCTGDVPCGNGVGVCTQGVYRCVSGVLGTTCTGGRGPDPMEICDGLDNDCNGIVDDPAVLARFCVTPYGDEGICNRGTQFCADTTIGEIAGAQGYRVDANGDPVCIGQVLPEDREICDALDHDCDGDPFTCTQDTCAVGPDPAFVGNVCGLGIGVCTGTLECDENGNPNGGPPVLVCNAPSPTTERCNNLDDNCNGSVDEGAIAGTDLGGMSGGADGAFCGTETRTAGVCNPGAFDCVNGHWQCKDEAGPRLEVCNGVDDDCDGTADEAAAVAANDPRIGEQCGTTTGECEPGTSVCSAGTVVCTPVRGPIAEDCNGKDDDCDNLIDEKLPDTLPPLGERDRVPCGVATGLCEQGELACVAVASASDGFDYQCVGGVGPAPELCDGEDNDCDSSTDECTGTPGTPAYNACDNDPLGAVGPAPTNQGLGAGGGDVCGSSVAPCTPGKTKCVQDINPSNGNADEPGFVCVGAVDGSDEVCNGTDDDCDTKIDEDVDEDTDPRLGVRCGANVVGPCRVDTDGDGPDDTEDDACGKCQFGRTACVSGAVDCIGEQGPAQYERCNGADDDCDAEIDECVDPASVPDMCDANEVDPNTPVGTACGEGACMSGINRCIGGALECEGLMQGETEICNNVDDDCDSLIDEGFAKGAACGKSEGECQPGMLVCDPDGSGTLMCRGEVPPADKELCNSLDDDCDGKIDEGVELGGSCGTDEGECAMGTEACVNGRYVCQGEGRPGVETCDCKDNDCDGEIDEAGDSPLCPGGAACVMCQCALPCAPAEEFSLQCPQGKAAVEIDDECFCVGEQCKQRECQETTITAPGTDTVLCAPDHDAVSACTCKNNACTFRCQGVTCDDALVCDPTDGRCKQRSCLLPQFRCPDDQRCTISDSVWQCVDDACAGKECADGEACRDGVCVKSCAEVDCSADFSCKDGTCTPNRCHEVQCDPGQVCDPESGDCVQAGACVRTGCGDGQICDPVAGECQEDPCLRTRCGYGEQCNSETGECELRCFGGLLYCGDDDCVNPLTSRTHCGAKDDCRGDNAGEACADGLVCSRGACSDSCGDDLVNCDGECIDPRTDMRHCGASGSCGGDEQGEQCRTGTTCKAGRCESIDPTPPPRRPDGTRVIASGGGGCTCSTLGAQAATPAAPASRRGLFASLLLALGAAWLLRRRRALRPLSGVSASIGLALFASSLTTVSSGCKVDTFCLDCAAPVEQPPVGGDGSGESGRTGNGGSGGTTGMQTRPDAMVVPDAGDAMVMRSDAGCAARELCNGLDDDCDDVVDEDADPAEVNIDVNTNPSHCGGCGQACALDHAFNACVDGTCRIDRSQGAGGCDIGHVDLDELDENGCEYGCTLNASNDSDCDSTDNDCDGKTDEDVDLAADADHCGRCDVRCNFAHAASGGVCVSGECVLDTARCDDNFADTDGMEANGCEYRCPVWPTVPETCNGLDDDCDHQTDEDDAVDENDARIGEACGDDRGECAAGVVKCINGTPQCDGAVGPSDEVCDGLDNDCDETIDTDHPDIGLPCGDAPPGSQCSKGTLQIPAGGCSDGDVLELVCVGAQGPVDEVCDGLDNDCDGRADEAVAGVRPGEGQACINGSNGVEIVTDDPPGECQAGQTRCVSGNLVCRNEVAPEAYDLCDGLDRDCDGQAYTDFTFSGDIATGGPDPRLGDNCGVDTGECAFGALRCHRDTNSLTCDNQTLPAAETCDGRDNDCDGRIDERAPNGGGADVPLPGEGMACVTNGNGSINTNPPASASRGECSTGTTVCNAGRMGCQGEQGPQPEQCDALDQDCDGDPVNGVATTDARIGDSCGPPTVGVCRAGVTVCSGGANPQVTCQGALPSATYVPPAPTNSREITCDGLDNDCDGAADEGTAASYDGAACCELSGFSCCPGGGGTRQCNNGRIQCVYPAGANLPVPEACGNVAGGNGADDDCDGRTDEGFNTQTDVNNCGGCGISCTPTGNPHGVIVCEAGKCKVGACDQGWVDADFDNNPNTNPDWQNGCERTCTFQGTDVCDGQDDDCDGRTDEVPVPQQVCQQYNRGVCQGVSQLFSMGPRCSGGEPSCNVQAVANAGFIQHYEATETSCDGRDNDCDGRTDEAQPMVGQPCSNGQGACRTTGVYTCGGGCSAPPALPSSPEICDGIDNNCNGTVDDFAPPTATGDNFELVNLGANTGNTLVMAFEASRPDADDETAGTLTHKPCSTGGVLPWTNVTWGEARAACCALNANGQCAANGTGWRLCDASTWKFACSASSGACDYGYSNVPSADCDHALTTAGFENVCLGAEGNGLVECDDDVNECPGTTGSLTTFQECRAEWGATDAWDLSGNVQEWTNTQVSTNVYAIRGGSYSDIEIGRTCEFDFEVGSTSFRFPTTGFRCCNYPAAPSTVCTQFPQTTDVTGPNQGMFTSTVSVTGLPNPISTVRVLDLQGTISNRFSDLQFRLIGPAPTSTSLLMVNNNTCGNDQNWAFDLRDDATNIVQNADPFCAGTTLVGGGTSNTYRPLNAFTAFSGQSANGTWTLQINDLNDRGIPATLTNWVLEVCTPAYVIP